MERILIQLHSPYKAELSNACKFTVGERVSNNDSVCERRTIPARCLNIINTDLPHCLKCDSRHSIRPSKRKMKEPAEFEKCLNRMPTLQ